MFALLPLELKSSGTSLPLANQLIIAANVVVFALTVLCGWYWVVGPGTGFLSVLLYGFSHAGWWHLVLNMWTLWVFGNPVNRRVGNGWYALIYVGAILVIGTLGRCCCAGYVLGASGGVFAVLAMAMLLLPSARLTVAWGTCFPWSLVVGLFRRPRYGIEWFLCGGMVSVKCWWGLVLVPLSQCVALLWSLGTGYGGVWNFGHLLGMVCGIAAVLLLPKRISMGQRAYAL